MSKLLINGITILNKSFNAEERLLGIVFTILCIIGVIYFSLTLVTSIKKKFIGNSILLSALIIVLLIIVGFVTLPSAINPKIQYEVTISDDVKLKEFNENYSIISKDGDIYTIQEKEK